VAGVWASKKLDKIVRDERVNAYKKICKHHSDLLGSQSTLTEEVVMAWLVREEPEGICQALKIPESQQKKFMAAVSIYSQAFRGLAGDGGSSLSRYVKFYSVIKSKKQGDVLREAISQAQGETLPDDVFFLPCIPGMEERGAVVLLREIMGIPYASIRYRLSEVDSHEYYLRSARLKPEIKYALSQAFGSLYSKIGLSAEYEARRKSAIAKISSCEWS
jgi:hypothetical protein